MPKQPIYFNKWTLTFDNPQISEAYEQEHRENVFWATRSYLPVAMCHFALCAIADPYTLPQNASTILLLRFAVVIPLLLLEHSLIVLAKKKYLKYYLFFNLFEAVVMNFAMLTMVYVAEPTELAYYNYCFGFFIIGLWFQSPKFKVWESFAYILLSIICYNAIAIFHLDLIVNDFSLFLINNIYFLIFFTSFVILAYWREDFVKQNFFLQYQLNDLSQNLEQKVKERTEELEIERKKTNKALIDGQEMERTRLGQDLHDDLGIQIISLKHQVEIDQQNPSYEKMKILYYRIDQIYQSMRSISKNMLPYSLKTMGLVLSIQDLCNNLENKMDHLQVITKLDTNLIINCETTQIYLYRIIQELITNTIKHAQASTIKVDFFQQEDIIHLIIEDDGIGFNENKTSNGVGIRNVMARIHLLNGKYQFNSSLNKGSRIAIQIPNIASYS